jgi:hypothetical protein
MAAPLTRLRGLLRGGALLGVAMLGWAACGGDTASTAAPVTPAFEPKLSNIESKVFGPSCGLSDACHGGDNPQKDLRLVPPVGSLLDRMSKEVPGRKLIVPGDPEASFLYEKIASATPAFGNRMPDKNPALAPGVVAAVREWILAGAKSD